MGNFLTIMIIWKGMDSSHKTVFYVGFKHSFRLHSFTLHCIFVKKIASKFSKKFDINTYETHIIAWWQCNIPHRSGCSQDLSSLQD